MLRRSHKRFTATKQECIKLSLDLITTSKYYTSSRDSNIVLGVLKTEYQISYNLNIKSPVMFNLFLRNVNFDQHQRNLIPNYAWRIMHKNVPTQIYALISRAKLMTPSEMFILARRQQD